MPRNISAAMKLKMASDSFSLATMVTITRRDGVVLAFTSWDVPFTYGGVTFSPTSSLQSKSLKQTASSGTDGLEVTGIIDSSLIKDFDLINGKYDGARVLIQEIDPTDLGSGAVTLIDGYSGELTIDEGSYVGEVRSKSQKMTQQFGDMCSGSCRVNQLGDSDCAPGGFFADGSTLSNYQQSGTVVATDIAVAATAPTRVVAINCGGPATGGFSADTGGSGGVTESFGATINVGYQNSAPAAIYQTDRRASPISGQAHGSLFTYTITGLTTNQIYDIILHFAENYFPTAQQISAASPATINGVGMRLLNVQVNGNIVIESYDITQQAGGKNIATNTRVRAQANGSGIISLEFDSVLDNALVCGIEVITLASSGISNGLSFNSAPNRASGVFNHGKVTMTSGLNSGLQRDIKVHYLNGSLTQIGLQELFPYHIVVGDTATLEWGCDRLPTTCRGTFHNFVNFQGEPWLPGNDQLIATGRPPS